MIELQIFRTGKIIAGVLLYLEPVIGLNDYENTGDMHFTSHLNNQVMIAFMTYAFRMSSLPGFNVFDKTVMANSVQNKKLKNHR